MTLQRTYSLDEIIELTGYDRRTIAYYVQKGILPRVGRRGPRTRYSGKFLDRLLYIKRVKEFQDTGRMRTVSLAEIRDILDTKTDQKIHAVASGAEEPKWTDEFRGDVELDMFEETDHRSYPGKSTGSAVELDVGTGAFSHLKKLLTELERRAIDGKKQQRTTSAERWTQVPITDNINLSVRGVRDTDLEQVAAVARAIRDLVSD